MKKNIGDKQIYVISGGPGFGKTALITALKKKGFLCGIDVAREYIYSGEKIPPRNTIKFNKIIMKKRIQQYKDAPKEKVIFFDRGIPDSVGYIKYRKLKIPEEYNAYAKKFRYQKNIFLTPPWKKIFEADEKKRSETFNEAATIHNMIKKVYQDLDYKIINVPKTSISKRVDFILSKI